MTIKMVSFIPKSDVRRDRFVMLIAIYSATFRDHLRKEVSRFGPPQHVPNNIAAQLYRIVQEWHSEGVISGHQLRVIDLELG